MTIANFISYYIRFIGVDVKGLIISNLTNDSSKKGEVLLYDNKISNISLEKIPLNKWWDWFPIVNKGYKFLFVKNNIDEIGTININWKFRGLIKNYLVMDLVRYSENCSIYHLKELFKDKNDSINLKVMEAYEKRAALKKSFDFRLGIAYVSNNFGLSILRPFIWVMFFIVLQYILFIYLSNLYCPNEINPFIANWASITNLISPVHKTSVFTNLLDSGCLNYTKLKNKITLFDNLFRIMIGYVIFQFVSAYRYKFSLK